MGKDDFLELIKDIGMEVGGDYPTADLYRWYRSMMEEEGREPVSHRKFGLVLKSLGLHNTYKTVDRKSVRCWLITNPWIRRAADPAEYDDPR